MLRFLKKITTSIVLSLAFLGLAYSEISDEQLLEYSKELENIIIEGKEKINIPGVIFAVSRSGKTIYSSAIGKTTLDSNSPEQVTKEHMFPVSSFTKNVTAILVGALVDEGKISFDDKVRKYWPDFFLNSEDISEELTIRDLISHRCGFKHFSADTLFQAGYSNQKVIDAFKCLKLKPGHFRHKYGYQNIVFGLVGTVLEKATGERYEDLVQKYLFDKMDMKNSSAIRPDYEDSKLGYFKYMCSRFDHDKERLGFIGAVFNVISKTLSHKSKKIVKLHGKYVDETYPLEYRGAHQRFAATSGISFSAEDIAKWAEMISSKGMYKDQIIVSEKTFNELTSYHATISDLRDDDTSFDKHRFDRDDAYYGMGFFKFNYSDNGANPRTIYFHMGGIYGSTAFFAYCPEEDFTIAAAANLGGTSVTQFPEYMVQQFLDMAFGFSKIDWVQVDIDNQNKVIKMINNYHKNIERSNPGPMSRMGDYVGTYTSDMYGDINVSEENGELWISNGLRKSKLQHMNRDSFKFKSQDFMDQPSEFDEIAMFNRNERGRIDNVYVSCLNENHTTFKKK